VLAYFWVMRRKTRILTRAQDLLVTRNHDPKTVWQIQAP